jgi:integrase
MRGARPLSDEEANLIEQSFRGRYAARDRALFVLGVRTGFRITELLSLTIGDVSQAGRIVDRITVARRNTEGKREGRTIPLHPQAKEALAAWLKELDGYPTDTFVFHSRKGGNRAITKQQAGDIIRDALRANGIHDRGMGTHVMRKTFAKRVYLKTDRNLLKTQAALGHRNINSTVQYLAVDQDEVDDAILRC